MEDKYIYIQPGTVDYAGHATFVFAGTTASSFGDLHSVGGDVVTIVFGEESREDKGDELFPVASESNALDEDLVRFYKKKGYKY